ncbi:hypothetical protein [Flavobacterium lacisediminis]|uniref:Uncharacterized protein n=1 Tax=Flavobacterium lacisediminis TaxID=2989705 RepID=A0ABT3EG89_9FLAO|nr:hypothetical protein [Flavobacterium lacisediminis]MCW1147591.1 hypothetical protein [Flavobacterium lacisediminis]
MKNIRLNFIILPILLFLASCGKKEKQFDKSTWNLRDDITYSNRESMVADLIENHLQEGMTYKELIDLLGKPENYSDIKQNTVAYEIMVDYGWNIDPVAGKTLLIEMTNDSLVKNIKLDKWEH